MLDIYKFGEWQFLSRLESQSILAIYVMIKIEKELKDLIESEAIAFSTSDEKGNPHVIAVCFSKVISKDEILITDNYMNETLKNLQHNQKIALAVWNSAWKENCVGYELKGIATYLKSGKWLEFVKKMPENKGMPSKGAILIKILRIKKVA